MWLSHFATICTFSNEWYMYCYENKTLVLSPMVSTTNMHFYKKKALALSTIVSIVKTYYYKNKALVF